MRRPCWLVLILGGAVSAVGAGDDAARRRHLDQLRADPEQYLRLRRDFLSFRALPKARKEQMRQLDKALHPDDPARRARLWTVLDRYAAWLDKLPESERRKVADAAGPEERLRVVRELRERQYIERLPARTRDEFALLSAQQKSAKVARLREEDRKRRMAWKSEPAKLEQFPKEVRDHVEMLMPQLSEAELQRLKDAEGKWPDLAKVIHDLSNAHPVYPPLPSGAIASWKDLPKELKVQLDLPNNPKARKLRQESTFGWPKYAQMVTNLLREAKVTPPPLGASRLSEMSPEVRTVVQEQLLPHLTPSQREALTRAEGKWPDYPRELLQLARSRGVILPGMSLPGPPELWEAARRSLRDVPDRVLMRFVRYETTDEDRARWGLDKSDPVGSRIKIQREWYRQQMPGGAE